MQEPPNAEITSESTVNDPASSPGAFFLSAQHFMVSGGIFTSNVTNVHQNANAPTLPYGK
ncbi:hypothetical protein C8R44DRAFT_882839 [Mycena epipterygia]|nr:hypothetical protein C8R44DRAFT_882839 [Mycena epipterygia]